MKINKIIFLPLLLWLVSCNEDVPQIQTENEVVAPLVSRITIVDGYTNETRTEDYYYDDGLLTRINFGNGNHVVYKYENGQLIGSAFFRNGEAESGISYVYRDGAVSTIHRTNAANFNGKATEFEYVSDGPNSMVINVYSIEHDHRVLQHYSACSLENGNVVKEVRYNLDGTRKPYGSTATFNNVIDPLGRLKGHPALGDANMASSTIYYDNGAITSDHKLTNYQVNEHNYPESYELISSFNGEVIRSTYTYEYQ